MPGPAAFATVGVVEQPERVDERMIDDATRDRYRSLLRADIRSTFVPTERSRPRPLRIGMHSRLFVGGLVHVASTKAPTNDSTTGFQSLSQCLPCLADSST